MARSSRGDLFLQIGGDITQLRAAVTAGKSVLNEFGTSAIDIQAEVGRALDKIGDNAPAQAKALERAYSKTFDAIRSNAEAALAAPNGAAAADVLNAAATRQAADAAEAKAGALRLVADAAVRADNAAEGLNAEYRAFAVSAEVAAQEAAQYATALRGQAGVLDTIEAELVGATGAQQRFGAQQGAVTRINGQHGAGLQQLSFQIGDVATQYAAGTPPMIIFGQQIGQVTQAISLMTAGTSGFLGWLAKWGPLVGAAGVILIPLIGRLLEAEDATDDLVGKMREQAAQARLNEQANRVWESSLDGMIEKTRKLNEETNRRLLKPGEDERTKLNTEAKDLAGFERRQRELLELLKRANKAVADARTALAGASAAAANAGPEDAGAAASELAGARANLAGAQAQVRALALEYNGVTKAAGEAGETVRNLTVLIARADATAQSDPITAKFNQQREAAERTIKDVGKLAAKLIEIDRLEDAARKKAPRASTGLPQVTRDEVAGLIGTPINRGGGLRSVAENKRVGGAANSYHLSGTAIDIPLTLNGKPLTKAGIRAALEPAGVLIKELLGPGDKGHDDHFHIAFDKTRQGADKIAARAAAAAKRDDRVGTRAVDKKVDQDDNLAGQLQRLDEQLLSAKFELVTDVDAQIAYAKAQVDADQQRLALAVQNDVNDGRLRAEQGAQVIAAGEAVAIQRKANIFAKGAAEQLARSMREQDEAIAQAIGFQVEELEAREADARTLGERRALQLQILDLVYEERLRHLEYLKAQAELAKNTAEAARIQAEINNLPREKARAEGDASDGTKSPLDRYRDELPSDLADIQERLEEIQVTGLKALEDDLVSAASKALGLKGALGEVVDQLLRLAFQMAASALGGNLDISAVFGGGRASGGPVSSSRFYMVGEKGPELFIPNGSGTIIPNHVLEAASLPKVPRSLAPRAGNDNGRGSGPAPIVQNFNFPNSDHDSFRRNESQAARRSRRAFGQR
jgi:uncharacterized protein YcbK (DUF882 family)